VLVATIYIAEMKAAPLKGTITREQFESLAIATFGRGRPDIGLMSLFRAVFCGILARQ
jgi:Na+/H+ antiporter NhaB